jgi:hypothetical protein
MKKSTIIIGLILLLFIGGYFLFPFVVTLFKSLIGIFAIILIVVGIFIGYIIPKRKRNE